MLVWQKESKRRKKLLFTLKNPLVEPPGKQPYAISVCPARSSALFIVSFILDLVRNAARLAVYEETQMRQNNHQNVATIRVGTDFGMISVPGKQKLQKIIDVMK